MEKRDYTELDHSRKEEASQNRRDRCDSISIYSVSDGALDDMDEILLNSTAIK